MVIELFLYILFFIALLCSSTLLFIIIQNLVIAIRLERKLNGKDKR